MKQVKTLVTEIKKAPAERNFRFLPVNRLKELTTEQIRTFESQISPGTTIEVSRKTRRARRFQRKSFTLGKTFGIVVVKIVRLKMLQNISTLLAGK